MGFWGVEVVGRLFFDGIFLAECHGHLFSPNFSHTSLEDRTNICRSVYIYVYTYLYNHMRIHRLIHRTSRKQTVLQMVFTSPLENCIPFSAPLAEMGHINGSPTWWSPNPQQQTGKKIGKTSPTGVKRP